MENCNSGIIVRIIARDKLLQIIRKADDHLESRQEVR